MCCQPSDDTCSPGSALLSPSCPQTLFWGIIHPSRAFLSASQPSGDTAQLRRRKLPRLGLLFFFPPSLHFLNIPVSTGNCSLGLPVIVKQKAERGGGGGGGGGTCSKEMGAGMCKPLTANHSLPLPMSHLHTHYTSAGVTHHYVLRIHVHIGGHSTQHSPSLHYKVLLQIHNVSHCTAYREPLEEWVL